MMRPLVTMPASSHPAVTPILLQRPPVEWRADPVDGRPAPEAGTVPWSSVLAAATLRAAKAMAFAGDHSAASMSSGPVDRTRRWPTRPFRARSG
jgi:hypothetical protein